MGARTQKQLVFWQYFFLFELFSENLHFHKSLVSNYRGREREPRKLPEMEPFATDVFLNNGEN